MRKLLAGLLLFAAACSTEHADYGDAITNEVVVDFDDNVSQDYIDALGRKLGIVFKPESMYSAVDKVYIGEVAGDESKALNELRRDGRVEAADENGIYTIPEHNLPADEEGILATTINEDTTGFPNDPRKNE